MGLKIRRIPRKLAGLEALCTLRKNLLNGGLSLLNAVDLDSANAKFTVLTNESMRMRVILWWCGRYTRHNHLHVVTNTVVQLPHIITKLTVQDGQYSALWVGRDMKNRRNTMIKQTN